MICARVSERKGGLNKHTSIHRSKILMDVTESLIFISAYLLHLLMIFVSTLKSFLSTTYIPTVVSQVGSGRI